MRKPFEIVEMLDGSFAVTFDGIQYGSEPRDLSGCSSQTWPTYDEALEAAKTASIE